MSMRRQRRKITDIGRIAILSCALMSAAAMGQSGPEKDAAANTSKDIVVKGQTQSSPAVVDRQASAITQNPGDRFKSPLAEFQEPVCPGIVGLPRVVAEVMIARIRSNAEVAGLDVAHEDKCEPNIMVFAVASGQQAIRDLQNKRSDLFRSIPVHELTKLAADSGPVHAWVNTVARSRHGDELRGVEDGDLFSPPTLYVANSHSHIWMASRRDITSSVIIFDFKAIQGMSAVQLADYATMRTFAQTRPVSDAQVTTILSLFDQDNARPIEMTDFDLAYLRAIYNSAANINASSKLGHINGELRKERAERAKLAEDVPPQQ